MKNIAQNDFEKKNAADNKIVCGIDEVGRGCLAGPLVTVALVLKSPRKNSLIKDSKLLDEKGLEKAYGWLVKNSIFSVSIIDAAMIDRYNIYQATQLSMVRAYYQLCAQLPAQRPAVALVDAIKLSLPCEVISIVRGEMACVSIAGASIVAKVTRDRIMKRLSSVFPQYGFQSHKGYGTKLHYQALMLYGRSPVHRMTFLKKFEQENVFRQTHQSTIFESVL